MRPKKPLSTSRFSLRMPGRKSLSCTTPCFTPAALAWAASRSAVAESIGERLLAINMLAGGNRCLDAGSAQRGQLRVEVDRVVRVGERGAQIGGPARHAMLVGDLLQLGGVAANQDRIGDQARAVRQRDAALLRESREWSGPDAG